MEDSFKKLEANEEENLNATRLNGKKCLNYNGAEIASYLITKPVSNGLNGVLENISVISFSGRGLESFPSEINLLRNVYNIDLSYNKLNYLPPEFGSLKNLIKLNLSHNKFRVVPHCIAINFYHIVHLDLSFNQIKNFSYPPLCLPFIVYLDLCSNELTSFPLWLSEEVASKLEYLDLSLNPCFRDGIPQNFLRSSSNQAISSIRTLKLARTGLNNSHLKILKGFTCLSYLNIGTAISPSEIKLNNVLSDLNIQVLKNLPLEELQAEGANLPELPADIDKLIHLKVLNCSNNPLILWLPPSFCQLQSLTIFNASRCALFSLPDEIGDLKYLKQLWLSCNQITSIPHSISKLKSLEILDLYDNSLEEFPTLLESLKGFDVGLNYCDPLKEPEESNYKVLRDYLRSLNSSQQRWDDVKEPITCESDDDVKSISKFSEYSSGFSDNGIERSFEDIDPGMRTPEEKWELNDDQDDSFDPNYVLKRIESMNSVECLHRCLSLQDGYYNQNFETLTFHGKVTINNLSDEEGQFDDAD